MEVNKHSKEFRERFLKILEGIDCNAIYFSGGMDSTTILFGMLELGKKPHLISFKQKNIDSKDDIIGTEIAKYYGLKRDLIETRTDSEGILEDVNKVIPLLKYPLKVHIQCCIPFIYMAQKLNEQGHTSAYTGLAAGDIFGLNRKSSVTYRKYGDEGLTKYRLKVLFGSPKLSDLDIWRVSEHFGVKMIDPFRDGSITELRENSLCDWMLKIPFKELHWKKEKSIFYHAFLNHWKEEWRNIGNMQIVSGLRDTHDEVLLNDPKVNSMKAKAIIKIYNELEKRIKAKSTLESFMQ